MDAGRSLIFVDSTLPILSFLKDKQLKSLPDHYYYFLADGLAAEDRALVAAGAFMV